MAAKEDILEQIVEEYLLHLGYFVRHNVKFLPRKDHPDFISNQDSNHSDIDVVGIHPTKCGADKVLVVSCKSWQSGFDAAGEVRGISRNAVLRGRDAWKSHRELVVPKWSEAFLHAVERETGERQFTYVTAVTKVVGSRDAWEQNQAFLQALGGNPIRILELSEMIRAIVPRLGTTMASTEVGRVLQLFVAAGLLT